jgi:hypothetical protein
MPEYHQIETYIDLKSDFSEVKLKCAEFFKSLGWLNSGVQEWLDTFSWEISEDGFVYSTKSHPKIRHQQFDIQLMLLGWTPKVFPSLATNCVELEILFETEKIDDLSKIPQIRYTKQAQNVVWHIMREANKHFQDYGIFFTDEAQDTNSWEGIIGHNFEKSWQFELAIINSKYKSRYTPTHPEYFQKTHRDELWLARKFVWDAPPWD